MQQSFKIYHSSSEREKSIVGKIACRDRNIYSYGSIYTIFVSTTFLDFLPPIVKKQNT